jgi:hypothetical protein
VYGFAGGDPVSFSDPFGLCKDRNGKERQCLVEWVGGAAGNQRPSAEATAVAQELATAADVDLYIYDGTRTPSTDCTNARRKPTSRHNCGLAFDIVGVGAGGQYIDFGTDYFEANPDALPWAIMLSAKALGLAKTREVFGPAGLFRKSATGQVSVSWYRQRGERDWVLSWGHKGHVHISIQNP